jgi:hypothetical protein
MTFSFKKELDSSSPEDVLPQNLPHKILAYIRMKANDFIDQVALADSEPANHKTIRFDPEILDIVTKIYISQYGDHAIDTSDINNIMSFQKTLSDGATKYCLALYRESVGRDSGIEYEKPTIENILTKAPEDYDCKKLFEHIRKDKCNTCANKPSLM